MSRRTELGSRTRGVWSRSQALAVLTPAQIETELRRGHWQRPWPGTYADAGCSLDAEQRAYAVVLASGGADQPSEFGPPDPDTGRRRRRLRAVASGRTAARLWQLPLIDDDDPATGAQEHLLDDVAVWRHLPTLAYDGRTVRRHDVRLGPPDLVQRPSGLWTTSLQRTLVDCAGLLSTEAVVCALDHALHRGSITAVELAGAVDRRAWCAGAVALRAATSLADARAESPAETLARLLLHPVLPRLEPQHRLRDDGGRVVARFDLGDERLRLAVEADGKAGHAGARMAAKDQRRDRSSEAKGWRTVRLVWWDLRRRPDGAQREVLTAAADQASRHGVSL